MALYIANDGTPCYSWFSAWTKRPRFDKNLREWDHPRPGLSCLADGGAARDLARALGVPLPKPGKCVKVPKIDKSLLEDV